MRYWNTKRLAEELKSGTLTSRERMKYLLAGLLLYYLLFYIALGTANYNGQRILVEASVVLVTTILGTLAIFRINERGDNVNFLDRYICLSFPLLLKIYLLVLLIMVVIGVLATVILGEKYTEMKDYMGVFISLLILLLYYWRMYVHLEFISGSAKAQ